MEIRHIGCGADTLRSIPKRYLLDAKWDAVTKAYVIEERRWSLDLRDYPEEIGHEIERFRKQNKMDEIERKLKEDLKRQKSSERVLLVFGYAVMAAFLFLLLLGVTYSQTGVVLVGVAFFVVMFFVRDKFARRFAPWLGTLKTEDQLFLRLREAIETLERFANGKGSQFLDEGVRLLEVSDLRGTVHTGGWAVVGRPAAETRELLKCISQGIAPAAQETRKNPTRIAELVLPKLKSLLPFLLEPDTLLIGSWNKATRNQFALQDRRPMIRVKTVLLSALPGFWYMLLMSAAFVVVGFTLAAAAVFVWFSFVSGSMLPPSEFLELVKGWQFVLAGVGLSAVPCATWFGLARKKK